MFKSGKKNFFPFVIIFMMIMGIFSSCDVNNSDNKNTTTSTNTTSKDEFKNTTNISLEEIEQKLIWNIPSNPTIDPSLNSSNSGTTIIRALFEGLTVLDENGNVAIGVAESLPNISSDELNYNFKISKDAKWSDGKNVSSKDFVYSVERALTLKTSSFIDDVFNIKNAKSYYDGLVSFDEVGIKATNDSNLEITLENPTPYFLELLTNPIFMPLRNDVVDEKTDFWTQDINTCITNGPFKLKKWTKDHELTVEKNDNYYDFKNIKLEEITFKIIKSGVDAVLAFNNNEIDYMERPPTSSIKELTDENSFKVSPYIGTYYLLLNQSSYVSENEPDCAKALNDVKVRKALSLAIDRQSIIDAITMSGEKPALSFVPYGIKDDKGNDFNDKNYINDNDIEKAKLLLQEAGYPNGENFPSLKYTVGSSEVDKGIAVAIQSMWKDNLGINVQLIDGENSQNNYKENKQYIITEDYRFGDYMDANVFLEEFYSKNPDNLAAYNNSTYDKQIESSKKELDKTTRISILKECESILLNDLPVIPIFFYTLPVAVKPYVKDISILPTGAVYFNNVYIDKSNNK